MGSKLIAALSVVKVDDLVGVDREKLVGIDSDAEKSRVSLPISDKYGRKDAGDGVRKCCEHRI